MLKTRQGFIREELEKLEAAGLKRALRELKGAQGRKITVNGREVLNFCSNNYLGLADDPRLVGAAKASLDAEGFGSGASRLVCGNMTSHARLEGELASFKGAEAALVFSSGYMANVGVISALFGRDDIIFSDRLNHASIIDGIILSQAKLKRYPHNDMAALEEMLRSAGGARRRVIITDSVFSMDGDLAPLDRIVELADRFECLVMVDEAHAFGVLGKRGKGAVEYFGLDGRIDIQMGTLSKAAGSFGAYVCGSRDLVDHLINNARSFIYTTGIPPSVAAASLRAVEIIRTEPALREKLWKNTEYLMAGIRRLGFNTLSSQTPIIPLIIGEAEAAVAFSRRLYEAGIFVPAIRPPTVPAGTSRLRVTAMANHTREDMDTLLHQLQQIGKDLCLI